MIYGIKMADTNEERRPLLINSSSPSAPPPDYSPYPPGGEEGKKPMILRPFMMKLWIVKLDILSHFFCLVLSVVCFVCLIINVWLNL